MRLITAIILVLIVIPTLYLPSPVLSSVIVIGIFIALAEFFDVGRKKLQLKNRHFLIPVVYSVVQYGMSYFSSSSFLLLLCVAFVALCIWCVSDQTMDIPIFLYILFVILYAGLTYEALFFIQRKAVYYLIFLFLAVFLTDTGAYFIGKRFGKHALAAHLSPKKTIEGAIGGIFAGTVSASLFILYFVPLFGVAVQPSFWFILIAVVLSIGSEFGDLFASKVKRFLQKKDFGFIFPGHGGIIDRVDGLVLASIMLYIILHFV